MSNEKLRKIEEEASAIRRGLDALKKQRIEEDRERMVTDLDYAAEQLERAMRPTSEDEERRIQQQLDIEGK